MSPIVYGLPLVGGALQISISVALFDLKLRLVPTMT